MYIIAHFYKEDSVEVVPSTWYKNNESAWPNKLSNVKKFVTRRTYPNKFDFNWFPARQLGRKFASYEEAKSKLSTAEFKSDLSTAEDERYTRQFRAANKRVSRNSSSPEIVKNSRSTGMKSPPSVFCMTLYYKHDSYRAFDNSALL
ncbi:uncharacterized protein LOC132933785 [Metopolophium dirhodum]|uniref:uncharacterized protein LOC132933785 n=1 Tax=Metopolophium dirhodum TaxID=44670 RepID=UPI00298FD3BF|nr:uncharacterized protein LOC132933785 [Metopolophium dirhodum]